MSFSKQKSFAAGAALAAVMGAALMAAPSAANADVTWVVNGSFIGGGDVTGYFDINVYGFLDGYNLTTTAGALPGFDYTPADSYYSNGTFYVDAQPGYAQDLHLQFADNLSVPVANNPIVGGDGGPSFECVDSFSCFIPSGGETRYIGEGFAAGAVPEPATWAMMLLGFFGLGVLLRAHHRADRDLAALAAG